MVSKASISMLAGLKTLFLFGVYSSLATAIVPSNDQVTAARDHHVLRKRGDSHITPWNVPYQQHTYEAPAINMPQVYGQNVYEAPPPLPEDHYGALRFSDSAHEEGMPSREADFLDVSKPSSHRRNKKKPSSRRRLQQESTDDSSRLSKKVDDLATASPPSYTDADDARLPKSSHRQRTRKMLDTIASVPAPAPAPAPNDPEQKREHTSRSKTASGIALVASAFGLGTALGLKAHQIANEEDRLLQMASNANARNPPFRPPQRRDLKDGEGQVLLKKRGDNHISPWNAPSQISHQSLSVGMPEVYGQSAYQPPPMPRQGLYPELYGDVADLTRDDTVESDQHRRRNKNKHHTSSRRLLREKESKEKQSHSDDEASHESTYVAPIAAEAGDDYHAMSSSAEPSWIKKASEIGLYVSGAGILAAAGAKRYIELKNEERELARLTAERENMRRHLNRIRRQSQTRREEVDHNDDDQRLSKRSEHPITGWQGQSCNYNQVPPMVMLPEVFGQNAYQPPPMPHESFQEEMYGEDTSCQEGEAERTTREGRRGSRHYRKEGRSTNRRLLNEAKAAAEGTAGAAPPLIESEASVPLADGADYNNHYDSGEVKESEMSWASGPGPTEAVNTNQSGHISKWKKATGIALLASAIGLGATLGVKAHCVARDHERQAEGERDNGRGNAELFHDDNDDGFWQKRDED